MRRVVRRVPISASGANIARNLWRGSFEVSYGSRDQRSMMFLLTTMSSLQSARAPSAMLQSMIGSTTPTLRRFLFPRIEYECSSLAVLAGIARDDRKAVMSGCGCDEKIRLREGVAHPAAILD